MKATAAVDRPMLSNSDIGGSDEKVVLEVKGLTDVIAETRQKILKGVDLVIRQGENRSSSSSSTFTDRISYQANSGALAG